MTHPQDDPTAPAAGPGVTPELAEPRDRPEPHPGFQPVRRTLAQRIRRRFRITSRLAVHLSRKLLSLTGPELREMLWAQAVLGWAQWTVWTRPRGSLVGVTASSSDVTQHTSASEDQLARARALGKAMNRAAYHGLFRPQCLVRSVALQHMLDARGLHGSRVCVGVRMLRGRFDAHAWVEYHGSVIGDYDYHIARFVELSDVQMVHRS